MNSTVMFWVITVVYVMLTVGMSLNFWFKKKDYLVEIDRLNDSRKEAYELGRETGQLEGYLKAKQEISQETTHG